MNAFCWTFSDDWHRIHKVIAAGDQVMLWLRGIPARNNVLLTTAADGEERSEGILMFHLPDGIDTKLTELASISFESGETLAVDYICILTDEEEQSFVVITKKRSVPVSCTV